MDSTTAAQGSQSGRRRPPPPGFPPEAAEQGLWPWFQDFLRDELRPYPGRVSTVVRIVIAATLSMVVIMTFRIPGAALASYYTLMLARESPSATLRNAGVVMASYLAAGLYCLIGIWLFIDYPLPHFLWVVFSLFLCFFLIKVMNSYVASAAFAFTITIVVPLWDAPLPQGALLTGTLWSVGSVSIGLVCTVLVEYVSSAFSSTDELLSGLSDRLSAVAGWMRAESGESGEREEARRRIAQLAMVGTSRLRRLALSEPSGSNPARSTTTVSLVGRLVDIAAALPARADQVSDAEKQKLRTLAEEADRLNARLVAQPRGSQPPTRVEARQHEGRDPLIVDLESTVDLLNLSLTNGGVERDSVEQTTQPASAYFVSDAFSNSEHLYYALRGCLAATLCYMLLNAIAWRGLSTSLATCVITALSSVGSSRQKQVLRLGGAIVGGVVFGIGSQALILPALDSIGGFILLFVAVTAFAAWFGTSSPRLSYFGLQVTLAFYLIHLQEFYPQTNLAIGRDRVMGILLGLAMMWLVYERLGSAPAIQVMRQLFATNLGLLAELAELFRYGRPAANRVRVLRDRISSNFALMNSQADAVLFETGRERERHLALRDELLALQPDVRSVFLVLAGLVQYRLEVDPATLDAQVRQAQMEFDAALAESFRHVSSLLDGNEPEHRSPDAPRRLSEAQHKLEDAVRERGAQRKARAEGILALNASLVAMVRELEQRAAALQPSSAPPKAGENAGSPMGRASGGGIQLPGRSG